MNAVWSYVLAGIGITGLLVAAHRPRVGWTINLGAQAFWIVYAVATRQWGFIAAALAYAIAYARLLRAAAKPPTGASVSEGQRR